MEQTALTHEDKNLRYETMNLRNVFVKAIGIVSQNAINCVIKY